MGQVVLVHGAWHGAWCWDGVRAELDRRGVPSVAVELPFTGFAGDVAAARAAIEAAGADVVVVGHSYGGTVISEAAAAVPGVVRLVYVCAFMTEPDEKELGILAAHGSDLAGATVVTDAGVTVDPARARDAFYGDSDDATAAALLARLRPMSAAAPGGPPAPRRGPAWRTVASTYVVCTRDRALPPTAQRIMAAHADQVVEWPTDHSPFVTRPELLAELVASHVPGVHRPTGA